MLSELVRDRHLPGLARPGVDWRVRREEILDLLRRHEYGYAPQAPERVVGTVEKEDAQAFASKAVQQRVRLEFATPRGDFSFPLDLLVPAAVVKPPVFLLISFCPEVPNRYLPAEELVDNGSAVAMFHYNDVTPDRQYGGGLADCYGEAGPESWGKIGMWAWAASRVMDYLVRLDSIDPARVAVVGHSRLGKTALWCGAQDERFSLAISNDSGCAGAALFRGNTGERLHDIVEAFPYWFCSDFARFAHREEELPFDQHFLLALLAPRHLYVSSAAEDAWADPPAEFLGAYAASEAYGLLGQVGLVHAGALPEVGRAYHEGRIGYHMRKGTHYLSRTDWLQFMAYRKKHGC